MTKAKLLTFTFLMLASLSVQAFTVEGLLGLMYRETIKTAPSSWSEISAKFEMTEADGRTNIKAVFLAKTPNSDEPVDFQVSNWGPINAALKIQEIKKQNNEIFSILEVLMKPDGSISYLTN